MVDESITHFLAGSRSRFSLSISSSAYDVINLVHDAVRVDGAFHYSSLATGVRGVR